MMDAFKEYFEYYFSTLCGIPEITLEGTVDDWKKLQVKTLSLAQFDLQWWTDPLKEILDEFVKASSGNVDGEFWKSIYKISHISLVGLSHFSRTLIGRSFEHLQPNSFLKS